MALPGPVPFGAGDHERGRHRCARGHAIVRRQVQVETFRRPKPGPIDVGGSPMGGTCRTPSGRAAMGHSARSIVPPDTRGTDCKVGRLSRHGRLRAPGRPGQLRSAAARVWRASRVHQRAQDRSCIGSRPPMSWLLGAASPPAADGRDVVDPAEAWESPVPRSTLVITTSDSPAGRLVGPACDTDVPPGVLRALRFACGSLPLERVLMMATSSRPIDHSSRRWVAARRQVLGFGERAAGLWVEGRGRDPAVVVRLERIGAVEDLTVLSFRRLSIRGADARLSLRYAPESRPLLGPPLAWLRRKIAGDARGEVPWVGVRVAGTGPIPDAWQSIADAVSHEAGVAGAAMVFGVVPSREDRRADRGAIVAITATELVVLAQPDPAAAGAWSSPQLILMPRRTLQGVRDEGGRLALRSAGVDRILRLGPSLTAAAADMIQCAGPAVSAGAG